MMPVKNIKREEDVSSLKPGETVLINGMSAMKKGARGDGVDYLISNGNGSVTIMNLRGYHISNGGIIPVWYSDRTISLQAGGRQ